MLIFFFYLRHIPHVAYQQWTVGMECLTTQLNIISHNIISELLAECFISNRCLLNPVALPLSAGEFHSSHCVSLSLHLLSSLSETVAELHSRWELPRTQRQLAAVARRCEFLRQPTGCAHHGVCLRADQSRRGTAESKHQNFCHFHCSHFAYQ